MILNRFTSRNPDNHSMRDNHVKNWKKNQSSTTRLAAVEYLQTKDAMNISRNNLLSSSKVVKYLELSGMWVVFVNPGTVL